MSLARLGVQLLQRSGVYDGYFRPWRAGVFDYAERRGLHILPTHYYTPIPDLRDATGHERDRRYFAVPDRDLDEALSYLSQLHGAYHAEFDRIAGRDGKSPDASGFRFGKAPYSTVEAEALYGIIRDRRPRRIVEIGCGHTTLLISEAIHDESHSGYAPTYTCIEPYRPDYLAALPKQVSEFIDRKLQQVPLDFFRELEAGDIVFIDSSHVVSYGSDTLYELLEILPVLAPGVLVHVHDIFLPYEYPWTWLKQARYFWAEQYMLDALIRGNGRYRVVLPLHQLYRERADALREFFPLLARPEHRPSAYWIEVASPK